MQAHTEELMSYQDILRMANNVALLVDELKEVKQELQQIKEGQQPKKKLVLKNAKDVAECIGTTVRAARDIMRHPNFPKSITKRVGKYNTGKWRADEVERFFRINKGKV